MGSAPDFPYDAATALEICQRLARGELLRVILLDRGMPSQDTFYTWVLRYAELKQAWQAAIELSARAFEEEALQLAREIKGDPGTGTKVRAYEVALGQLRWSASKRNPREYGDRGSLNLIVPIQINTPLDLGQGGAKQVAEENIYELTATVKPPDENEHRPERPLALPSPAPEDQLKVAQKKAQERMGARSAAQRRRKK